MSEGITGFFFTILANVILGDFVNVIVVLQMPDGSYVIFDLEAISFSTPELAYLEFNSAYDNQDNQIPTGGFGGIVRQGGSDFINEYEDAARRLGYLIRRFNSCNRFRTTFTCDDVTGRCTVTASPVCP